MPSNDQTEIRVATLDMGSALAPNTPARRKRRALQLIASRMWIVQHESTAEPCQLCPRRGRLGTYTSITASYLTDDDGIRICYVCLGNLSLARENGRREAERRLFSGHKHKPTTVQRRSRVRSDTREPKTLGNK